MSDYQIGKDMAAYAQELQRMQLLLEQMYNIIDFNLKAKKLSEPPEEKPK